MPTNVERAGIGVKAIKEVLEDHRELVGAPPSEVGKEFGGAISELNFALPTEKHLGGLLLPAVQEELGLLGAGPFSDGFLL